jgi:hypothetical protein
MKNELLEEALEMIRAAGFEPSVWPALEVDLD